MEILQNSQEKIDKIKNSIFTKVNKEKLLQSIKEKQGLKDNEINK